MKLEQWMWILFNRQNFTAQRFWILALTPQLQGFVDLRSFEDDVPDAQFAFSQWFDVLLKTGTSSKD